MSAHATGLCGWMEMYPYINMLKLVTCKLHKCLYILSISNITGSSLSQEKWQQFTIKKQNVQLHDTSKQQTRYMDIIFDERNKNRVAQQ